MAEGLEPIEFSKWRRRLWPFHRSELPKLVPLILIKFLVSLNYCLLTSLKDTMVVTAKGSGAEVITVLKGWVVLPMAMIVAILYSKLSNVLNKRQLFYTMLSGFLIVIFLYGFVLYPNTDFFTPTKSSDWLIDVLGQKHEHWIAVYRNWIQSLLFVTAELWAGVVIFVMFWGFANDITSVNEAKRSYNIYIAAGDVAAFSIGPIIYFVTKKFAHLPFLYTVQSLLALVLAVGLAIMAIYFWVNRYVLTDKSFSSFNSSRNTVKKTKEKLSLRQGFMVLIRSKYLLGIAIIVIGYGLTISLVEISWKASLKLAYPNPSDYQMLTAKATSCVGFFGFIISVFLGSNIIRRLGWHFSAQLTPILVGVSGCLFFCFILFQQHLGWLSSLFALSPLGLIVFFGAIQNVLSKVSKYSFFDPTKEMAYIPLDEDSKVKGKAAIDLVGSRLGKSGASFIQLGLLELLGTTSILNATHILLPIVAFVTVSWILSVRSLSKEFDKELGKEELLTSN